MKRKAPILQPYPIEIRILIIAAAGGIIFGLLAVLINLFLDLGREIIIISAASALIGVLTLYFAMVKKQYTLPAYFGVLSLMVIIYPYLWLVNGGSRGPIFFYMIFNAVFCAVLLAYLNFKIVLILQLCIAYALLAFEHFYPSAVKPYSGNTVRSIDIGLSFTIVFLVTYFMVVRIMKEYRHNIRELEEVKKELTSMNEKLTVISETDELTGICNRRCIMSTLNQRLFLYPKEELSLIMIDIDHFKRINDTYGHSTGDEVIRKIARVMGENIRSSDAIGRIGGEEFLIVLPGNQRDGAYAKAEKLRELISSLTWTNEDMHVTISGGVYCKKEDETLDHILDQADSRLYASKNGGRNRIS